MIEYLSPLIALFKIVIEGLRSIHDKSAIEKKKYIQRNVIDIQLQLENIIDDSVDLVTLIKNKSVEHYLSDEEVERLLAKISSIQESIRHILKLLRSDELHNFILRVFAPDPRRRLISLLTVRSFILDVLAESYQKKLDVRKGIIYVDPKWINLNHEIILNEKLPNNYRIKLSEHEDRITVFDVIPKYEQILAGLSLCSKDLSDFIKDHVKLDEVICLTRRSRRTRKNNRRAP